MYTNKKRWRKCKKCAGRIEFVPRVLMCRECYRKLYGRCYVKEKSNGTKRSPAPSQSVGDNRG